MPPAERGWVAKGKILIVGAGIGGLTAGVALRRAGFEIEVFERADAIREVGAGLTVQSNAVKALAELDLAAALDAVGARITTTRIGNAGGTTLAGVPFARIEAVTGFPAYGVHRAALQKLLHDALGHERVRLSSRATAFRSTAGRVTLELEGGRTAEGDALVGADGIRSAVRAQLLRDGEPRYAGYTCWRGVTERAGLVPPGIAFEIWGRGARFGGVVLGDGKFYWFAPVNAPPAGRDEPGETRRTLERHYAGWASPVPEILAATPEPAIFRSDIIDRPFAERWGEGPVTLLGDAAHPTTPNLGQGACQAIEDAVVLARALAKAPDLERGLRHYEDLRRERTRKVVEWSWRFGRMGQIENGVARALRDLATRLTPTAFHVRQLLWAQRFDPAP
jgi:2-polyprenyl-6-methoxyphenol hydroxylase-like FAD-dependent oxidoreductase